MLHNKAIYIVFLSVLTEYKEPSAKDLNEIREAIEFLHSEILSSSIEGSDVFLFTNMDISYKI